MRRPECLFKVLSFRHLACRARHRMACAPPAYSFVFLSPIAPAPDLRRPAQARERTRTQCRPRPACPHAQAAPSTFVSRGNAVRTPAGILHSFLAGALRIPLAAAELEARRISLRYLLPVPSSAGLDIDTPSLSWTIMGESFPLFISSHPASRSCHLSTQALRCSRSSPPPSVSASSRRASVIYGG